MYLYSVPAAHFISQFTIKDKGVNCAVRSGKNENGSRMRKSEME